MVNDRPLVDPKLRGLPATTPDDYLTEWGDGFPYAVVTVSGVIAVWETGHGRPLPAVYRNEGRARDAARTIPSARVVNLSALQAARHHHANPRVPLNPNMDPLPQWREAVVGPTVMLGRLGVWAVDHVRQTSVDGEMWETVETVETREFMDEGAATSYAKGLADALPAPLLTPDASGG